MTWFDQAGQRRHVAPLVLSLEGCPVLFADTLRPAVRLPNRQLNTKLRSGRGFTAQEPRLPAWPAKEAMRVGIKCRDHRRRNRCQESLELNKARLSRLTSPSWSFCPRRDLLPPFLLNVPLLSLLLSLSSRTLPVLKTAHSSLPRKLNSLLTRLSVLPVPLLVMPVSVLSVLPSNWRSCQQIEISAEEWGMRIYG